VHYNDEKPNIEDLMYKIYKDYLNDLLY